MDCVYREPGVKLDAGDKLILEHLDRLDNFVRSSLGALMKESGVNLDPFLASNGSISRDGMENKDGAHALSEYGSVHTAIVEPGRESITPMTKVQTNPALHLLDWPKIRELVSQPYEPQLLLQLEMKRKPLDVPIPLSLDFPHRDAAIRSFFRDANVWYACVNPGTWTEIYEKAESCDFREGLESCLVLLVLALGSTRSTANTEARTGGEGGEEPPGMEYFSVAYGFLPTLMISHDIVASQCIVLASAYLFYLVRPFEAWTLLSSTTTKLQLLFNPFSDISPRSKELGHRVVWNAILFESSLLSELELPQSNLIYCDASLDLPSPYPEDDGNPDISPNESWYLTATISLHRLQMRIHQAIYSKDAPTTTAALEPIVADLDASLSQWDESLPFDHHRYPPGVAHNHAHLAETCLLLRYHATRASIFRPFLLAVLDSSPPPRSPNKATAPLPPAVRSACTNCLESCVRQLEIVRAIDQQSTHSPYVWQETLSAVSQTLLVMGASMVAPLADLLVVIDDLNGLIQGVVTVVEGLGRRAPSLKVAGEILREADGRRRGVWWKETVEEGPGRGGGGGGGGPGVY